MGGTEIKEKVVAGVDEIIERAVKHNVTDIHIEPGPRFVLVRYRQGGTLYVANKLPSAHATTLAKHFKKLAELEISNIAEPQIGTYELKLGRKAFNVQVATLPVIGGEKITIRLHELASSAQSLEQLGLWGANLNEIKHSLTTPHGLIVVAGRQANHLNTTLAALLQTLESPMLKAAFINHENWPLPLNIKQVTSRPNAGLNTARQLAILRREHFDLIGINNISEPAAVQETSRAAEHCLVLAGLLADSALAGLKLFVHLQTEVVLLPSVLGQQFVRKLCEHCRESYEPTSFEKQQLNLLFQTDRSATISQLYQLEKAAKADGLGGDVPLSSEQSIKTLWRAKQHGCSHCDHTGFSGEVGIFEFCKPGEALNRALNSHEPASALQKIAVQDGMISLKVDSLIKALRGLIDLPTCLSVCASSVIK